MKKTTLVKLLALLMLLFVSVGSTLAYLTDVEQEVNVMTLGRVEIDLIEKERNAAGNLTDFQDNHPLYPGYYPKGLDAFDKDGYWLNVQNVVDKVVTVKNTGKAPAYVRLWFAFEVTDDDKFFNKIHLNRNATDWQWKFMYDKTTGNFDFLTQDGSRYVVATATYNQVLAPNATTPVSLRQVLLDSSATNDDLLKLGDKYSIFVVAQGMQSAGFDKADQALNEGFGVPSGTNHPFAGMREDSADESGDVLVISTPEELIAFSRAVTWEDEYMFTDQVVVLGADIDMAGYSWDPITIFAYPHIRLFDGQGHTIKNLSNSLFDILQCSGNITIQNVNIDGGDINSDYYGGAILSHGCLTNVTIDNCHISNITIDVSPWAERNDIAGALVGYMEYGTIKNCSVTNCKVFTSEKAGIIVGQAWGTDISNCKATNVSLFLKQKDDTISKYIPSSDKCNTLDGTIHTGLTYKFVNDYESDGRIYHNAICRDCGEAQMFECSFICSDSATCKYCSSLNVKEYSACKQHQWENTNITATTHTVACSGCGEVRRTEEHHAYCLEAKDGICAGCGASSVTIGNTWHYSKYSNINETQHVYMCYMCGLYTSDMEPHNFDIAGKCRQCGAVKVIPATGIGEIIAESNVALRKGPSSDYVVIDRLAPGTVVELLEIPSQISAKHWYKVQYNDTVGYVQSPYIKVLKLPDETDASSFTWTSDDTSVTITKYIGTATDVVIPATIDGVPVTGIAYQAFDRCTSMTSVIIPFSVTSIGIRAFAECTSLTSVTIPNSVTSIRDKAFIGCTNLTSITISDSVTEIDYAVFAHCTSLKSITIPESVTRIGESAFSFCGSLKSITIPDSVTNIGDGAFTGCTSLTRVFLSESNQITSIGANAFWGCTSLSNIEDADTLLCLTSVGDYAFKNCSELQYFYFDEKVSEIGVGVFEGCTNINVDTFNNDYAAGYCRQNNIPGSHGGDG